MAPHSEPKLVPSGRWLQRRALQDAVWEHVIGFSRRQTQPEYHVRSDTHLQKASQEHGG